MTHETTNKNNIKRINREYKKENCDSTRWNSSRLVQKKSGTRLQGARGGGNVYREKKKERKMCVRGALREKERERERLRRGVGPG